MYDVIPSGEIQQTHPDFDGEAKVRLNQHLHYHDDDMPSMKKEGEVEVEQEDLLTAQLHLRCLFNSMIQIRL
ncbi:hypothetical protein BGZ51_000418, partial [Haplosporangium sp. Z 767]